MYFSVNGKGITQIIVKTYTSLRFSQNSSMIKSAFKSILCLVVLFLFFTVSVAPRKANAASPLKITALGKTYIFYPPQISLSSGEFTLNGIDEIVDRVYQDTLVKPINAELSFTPSDINNFSIMKEKSGVEIDRARLKAEIIYALDSGKRQITAKSQTVTPSVTSDYLKEETVKRAEFSTAYATSSIERKHNIELACKSLNGAIIDLYGGFSFNERVGVRTEERGYKQAKIILDGKFTDGLGGGVCQVSTTLYNAALRAGLNIKEYHRHSLAVSYVPPSFDAMVSGTSCDLRLENNTGRNIYVKAAADGKKITITLFGIKPDCEYRFRSVVDEVIFAEIKKVPAGSGEPLISPKNGLKSTGYMDVYRDNRLIASYKLRTDRYSPINGVVEESE